MQHPTGRSNAGKQRSMVSACAAMGLVDPPLIAVFDMQPDQSTHPGHKPCWSRIAGAVLQDAMSKAKETDLVVVGQDVHHTVSSTLDIDFGTYQRLGDYHRTRFREVAYVHLYVADIVLHESKTKLAEEVLQWRSVVTAPPSSKDTGSGSNNELRSSEQWTSQVVLLVNPYLLEHTASSESGKGKWFGLGKTEYASQEARLAAYEKRLKEKLPENVTVLKYDEGQTGKDLVKIALQACNHREKCLPLSGAGCADVGTDLSLTAYFRTCTERMGNCLRFGLVAQALKEAEEFRKPKAAVLFRELLAVKHQERLIKLCRKGWLCEPTLFRFEEQRRLPTLFEHLWYVTGLLMRFYLRVDLKKEALDVWHWFQRIVEAQAASELQSERLLKVHPKVSALLLYTTSYAAVKLAPLVKPWEAEMAMRLSGNCGRRIREEREEDGMADLDDLASAATLRTTTPSSISFGSVDVRQSLGIPFSVVGSPSQAGGGNMMLMAAAPYPTTNLLGPGAAASAVTAMRSDLDQASIKSNLGDLVVQLREYFQLLGTQCGYTMAKLSMRAGASAITGRGNTHSQETASAGADTAASASSGDGGGRNFGLDHLNSYESFLKHYIELSELAADTYHFAGRERSESLERWVFAEHSLHFPELIAQAALVVRTAVLPHFASSGWPHLSLRAHQLNLRCQDLFLSRKDQAESKAQGGPDADAETEEVGTGAFDLDSYVRSCMSVIQLVGDDAAEAARAWTLALKAVQQDDQNLGVSLPLDMLFSEMRAELEVEEETKLEAVDSISLNATARSSIDEGNSAQQPTSSGLESTMTGGAPNSLQRSVTVYPHGIHCEISARIDEPLRLEVWHVMPSCVSETTCAFTAEFSSKMDWDDEEEPLHALTVSEVVEGRPTLRQRDDGLYARTSSISLRPCHAGNYRLTSIEVTFQGGLLSFKKELVGEGPSPVVLRVPRPDPGFRISAKLVGDQHAFSLQHGSVPAPELPCYVEATITFDKVLYNKPPERPRPVGCSYSKQRRRSFVGRSVLGGNDLALIADLPDQIVGRLFIRTPRSMTASPGYRDSMLGGRSQCSSGVPSEMGSPTLGPDTVTLSPSVNPPSEAVSSNVATMVLPTDECPLSPFPSQRPDVPPMSPTAKITEVACVAESSSHRTCVPFTSTDLSIRSPEFRLRGAEGEQEGLAPLPKFSVESGSNAGGAFYFDFATTSAASSRAGSPTQTGSGEAPQPLPLWEAPAPLGPLPLGQLVAKIPVLPQFFRQPRLPVVFCCLRDGEPCVSRADVPMRFTDAFSVEPRFQLIKDRVFCSWEVTNVLDQTVLSLESAALVMEGDLPPSHTVSAADCNELQFGRAMDPGAQAQLLFILEQGDHFCPVEDTVLHHLRLEVQYTFVPLGQQQDSLSENSEAEMTAGMEDTGEGGLLNTFRSEVASFQSLHSCHFSGLVLVNESPSEASCVALRGQGGEHFTVGQPVTFDVFVEPTQRKQRSRLEASTASTAAPPSPAASWKAGSWREDSNGPSVTGLEPEALAQERTRSTSTGGFPSPSAAGHMGEEVYLQVVANPSEWLIVGPTRTRLAVSVVGGATSTCFKAMPLKEGSLSLPTVQLLQEGKEAAEEAMEGADSNLVSELRVVHSDITRCRETIAVGPSIW